MTNKSCKHKVKHTERFIVASYRYEVIVEATKKSVELPRLIMTWCADCGKKLKEVEVKD